MRRHFQPSQSRTLDLVLRWAFITCKMYVFFCLQIITQAFNKKHIQTITRRISIRLFFTFQITVPITKSFIEFLKTQPIIFKVFGHYQNHPLHQIAKQEYTTRPPPRRMLPPSIPISQPVRSPKFGPLPSAPSSTVLAKHDILVWFEICELAPNGEYVPSVVEHSDDLPCRGLFLLHQGIQRRIRITIVHEPTPEIKWKDIRELVVGKH